MEILPDNKDKWIFCNGIDQIISPNHKFTRFFIGSKSDHCLCQLLVTKISSKYFVSFYYVKTVAFSFESVENNTN